MKNEVKVFENEELGLQVRTIFNPDGSISVSAEDTAIGFGWCRTEVKNGKAYTSIRWATLNGYCKELGFAKELAKEDYIPESLYYLLGMKANNERAQKYQRWLAMDVLPALRKTGTYRIINKPLSAIEQIQLNAQAVLEVNDKVEAVRQDLEEFKQDMPILGMETDIITAAVHKRGVAVLGGHESNAYKDRSIRGKVYSDIYRELKRQFGVSTYKAIKRFQCDMAVGVIESYKPPSVLAGLIKDCNAQMGMEVA